MCELLSPAGDFEKLEAALLFGADAVYLGGEYGMRAAQSSFRGDALRRAVQLCHDKSVRIYLTINTLPRNREMDLLPEYLRFAQECGVDAVITTDMGVLSLLKKHTPSMEVHISTQAGIVNYAAATSFYKMGAKRVVLARELSLEEIAEIRARIPAELELEAFVHGAMCMSVSGRCLISNYLTGRDANRGECAQPCRWNYRLVEEKRPGEYFPVFEDEAGSYILNAKDLCMLPYIDKLAEAGVTSFKIEGRAKSSYYVSVVTNAYRIAMDEYQKNPTGFRLPAWLLEEVEKVSHRRYSTGFYYDTPDQYPENGGYIREWDIVAVCRKWKNGRLTVTQKNRFFEGDSLEAVEPGSGPVQLAVKELRDSAGQPATAASHPMEELTFACDVPLKPGSILRKQRQDT